MQMYHHQILTLQTTVIYTRRRKRQGRERKKVMENNNTTDPRGFVTVKLDTVDRQNIQHAGAKRLDRNFSGVQLVSSWWLALSRSAPEGIGIAGVKYVLVSTESRLRRKSKIQTLPAVDKVLRNYEYRHYDPNRTIALTPEEVSEVKAMDMSRLLEQLAHEKEHMFLRANFAGKPISLDDIIPVFTKEGRCFEINDGLNGTELLKSEGIGRAFGMTLVLNTEQDEYYYNSYLNDATGFIIQLLDQDEVPQVLEQGFDVGPGTLTSVAILATQHIYEKPPYGVCGEKKEKFYEKYSQPKCDLECMTDFVVGECGCRTAYMPGNATVCDPIAIATCTQYIVEHRHGELDNCTCPIECEKKTFSASLSSAKYPSNFRANLFEEYLNESVLNFPSLKRADSSFIKDNFVAVDLFFSSLGTNVITQQASYTIVSFMCDAGGAMGLWIGGSLLTLYEIIDLCGHSFFSTRHP
ncbi:acid-sensing ion channel 1 isoform X3 [Strongylocentrotus purpuratus]|uniref:Uncharacterized protein n=1 Tax=Strongylocentrotus purpuratus TaxID=7668 RepID=A0A7M7SXL8_STRPU|nr:acid-sensing ion channel 1 isoform X3 [Strongylocentrotus purpuratus]